MKVRTSMRKLLISRGLRGSLQGANNRSFGGQILMTLGRLVSISFLLCGFVGRSEAQLTILHNFGDGSVPDDGWTPESGLIQLSNGNFYGTTYLNPDANGTVFQMTPSGAVTILYTFTFGTYGPSSSLLYYGGGLVGTTPLGGIAGGKSGSYGTVFATALSGTTSFWHEFKDGTVPHDGANPYGSLIVGSDGFLYGTTIFGGTHNEGTIYKIDPANQKVTIVHSFSAGSSGPWGALVLAKDGNYYGTTTVSSTANTFGGIFKMTPEGKVSILYTFTTSGAAGYLAYAPLIQATDGNFYGVTVGGGTNTLGGTIFKMTQEYAVTVLHDFGNGKDGYGPFGALVQGPDGALYGTTTHGGTTRKRDAIGVDASNPEGYGIVFRITTDGTYKVLHNFGDGSVPNDGEMPDAPLTVGSDGYLYGTTNFGGSAGHGTVYKISP
jgi:uncharacterized repeat protein (TIGR03803 family)